MTAPARLIHVTTTDMSLALLLGPQLRAFRAAGYEVMGASAPGPWVPELEAAGVVHLPLEHATRAWAPHHDVAALRELHRLFRRLRPDIVHTHNPKPGFYGRLAARAARVPLVVNTVHGLYAQPDDRWRKRTAVYTAERLAARCSHVELVQNHEDLDTLARLGVPRHKLRLLGNGVDLGRFRPCGEPGRVAARTRLGLTDADLMVLAVGRLVAEKGYPELFEAMGRLRAVEPRATLVVAGPDDPAKDDGLTPADIDRARRQGVVFLGLRDDVEHLYSAADVYVLASHREGFPRSAMEAAASGLPVVATDIRGCRQVVDDGRTGVLVPRRDPAALAAALHRLCLDADLRRAMGRAATAKAAAEFDQEQIIAITLDTYAGRPALSGPAHRTAGARS